MYEVLYIAICIDNDKNVLIYSYIVCTISNNIYYVTRYV